MVQESARQRGAAALLERDPMDGGCRGIPGTGVASQPYHLKRSCRSGNIRAMGWTGETQLPRREDTPDWNDSDRSGDGSLSHNINEPVHDAEHLEELRWAPYDSSGGLELEPNMTVAMDGAMKPERMLLAASCKRHPCPCHSGERRRPDLLRRVPNTHEGASESHKYIHEWVTAAKQQFVRNGGSQLIRAMAGDRSRCIAASETPEGMAVRHCIVSQQPKVKHGGGVLLCSRVPARQCGDAVGSGVATWRSPDRCSVPLHGAGTGASICRTVPRAAGKLGKIAATTLQDCSFYHARGCGGHCSCCCSATRTGYNLGATGDPSLQRRLTGSVATGATSSDDNSSRGGSCCTALTATVDPSVKTSVISEVVPKERQRCLLKVHGSAPLLLILWSRIVSNVAKLGSSFRRWLETLRFFPQKFIRVFRFKRSCARDRLGDPPVEGKFRDSNLRSEAHPTSAAITKPREASQRHRFTWAVDASQHLPYFFRNLKTYLFSHCRAIRTVAVAALKPHRGGDDCGAAAATVERSYETPPTSAATTSTTAHASRHGDAPAKAQWPAVLNRHHRTANVTSSKLETRYRCVDAKSANIGPVSRNLFACSIGTNTAQVARGRGLTSLTPPPYTLEASPLATTSFVSVQSFNDSAAPGLASMAARKRSVGGPCRDAKSQQTSQRLRLSRDRASHGRHPSDYMAQPGSGRSSSVVDFSPLLGLTLFYFVQSLGIVHKKSCWESLLYLLTFLHNSEVDHLAVQQALLVALLLLERRRESLLRNSLRAGRDAARSNPAQYPPQHGRFQASYVPLGLLDTPQLVRTIFVSIWLALTWLDDRKTSLAGWTQIVPDDPRITEKTASSVPSSCLSGSSPLTSASSVTGSVQTSSDGYLKELFVAECLEFLKDVDFKLAVAPMEVVAKWNSIARGAPFPVQSPIGIGAGGLEQVAATLIETLQRYYDDELILCRPVLAECSGSTCRHRWASYRELLAAALQYDAVGPTSALSSLDVVCRAMEMIANAAASTFWLVARSLDAFTSNSSVDRQTR